MATDSKNDDFGGQGDMGMQPPEIDFDNLSDEDVDQFKKPNSVAMSKTRSVPPAAGRAQKAPATRWISDLQKQH